MLKAVATAIPTTTTTTTRTTISQTHRTAQNVSFTIRTDLVAAVGCDYRNQTRHTQNSASYRAIEGKPTIGGAKAYWLPYRIETFAPPSTLTMCHPMCHKRRDIAKSDLVRFIAQLVKRLLSRRFGAVFSVQIYIYIFVVRYLRYRKCTIRRLHREKFNQTTIKGSSSSFIAYLCSQCSVSLYGWLCIKLFQPNEIIKGVFVNL